MDERLRTAVEQSWLGSLDGAVTRLSAQLATAWGASTIGRTVDHAATRLSTIAAQSACIRWLTREPDPDVIVIDLAETRTLGPIIDLLRPASNTLARAYRSVVPIEATTSTEPKTRPFSRIVTQSTSWTLLERLLTPPEPPERNE